MSILNSAEDFNLLTDGGGNKHGRLLDKSGFNKADQSEMYYTINDIEQSHMQVFEKS